MLSIVASSGHSRFPVIGEDRDEVLGLLLAKDLLRYFGKDSAKDLSIRKLLRPAAVIPESKRLNALLNEFRASHNHMAIVVDEYGGTSGLVTLEDILEEIVGEFTTDPADDIDDVVQESATSFLVDATANIRELNRTQNWELPTEGPKTLNGLIVEQLETIPPPGTCLKANGYPIEIVETDDNRIRTVRIGQRIDTENSEG